MKKIIVLMLALTVILCAFSFMGCEKEPESASPDYYLVVFDSDGGTKVNSQSIASGGKVIEPNTPQKTSISEYYYTFLGWFFNDEKWDFKSDVVDKDLTLKAQWQKTEKEGEVEVKYTVTFDSDGGTKVNSQIIVNGGKVIEPNTPQKAPTKEVEYHFICWLYNGEKWNFDNDVVNQDITLVAKYIADDNGTVGY